VVNREAPVTPVPFERILHASQEPQNWLTYSGDYNGRRHSLLKQITPSNARELTLKWVYQSRSLDKNETTPLVVDGTMFTVQSPNDVVALNAATGKVIWQYYHQPATGTRNPCCGTSPAVSRFSTTNSSCRRSTRSSLPSMPRPARSYGRRRWRTSSRPMR
jgi:glucose dehydrogenase